VAGLPAIDLWSWVTTYDMQILTRRASVVRFTLHRGQRVPAGTGAPCHVIDGRAVPCVLPCRRKRQVNRQCAWNHLCGCNVRPPRVDDGYAILTAISDHEM